VEREFSGAAQGTPSPSVRVKKANAAPNTSASKKGTNDAEKLRTNASENARSDNRRNPGRKTHDTESGEVSPKLGRRLEENRYPQILLTYQRMGEVEASGYRAVRNGETSRKITSSNL